MVMHLIMGRARLMSGLSWSLQSRSRSAWQPPGNVFIELSLSSSNVSVQRRAIVRFQYRKRVQNAAESQIMLCCISSKMLILVSVKLLQYEGSRTPYGHHIIVLGKERSMYVNLSQRSCATHFDHTALESIGLPIHPPTVYFLLLQHVPIANPTPL